LHRNCPLEHIIEGKIKDVEENIGSYLLAKEKRGD
jgi:hypothetical protein